MKKRILLLSAYHAQSHRYWCEWLMANFSEYEWTLLSLPARFFSWRIRGNPLSFLADFADELDAHYDLCIATSMVDIATIKSIVPNLRAVPFICYFHENQFAYPINNKQHQSLEPKMVNLYSALAADKIVFNSNYNQQSFYQGVSELMAALPDKTPKNLIEVLKRKSQVLPVPLAKTKKPAIKTTDSVHLLWNHRWEYDKNPQRLHDILLELDKRQCELTVSIVGQQFRQQPPAFAKIKTLLDKSDCLQLAHWGYLPERCDYENLLDAAHIVLSTADHDFQGLSILEAVSHGALPVLPHALVYPEWFDDKYLYALSGSATEQAQAAADNIQALLQYKNTVPDLAFLQIHALKPQYQQMIHAATLATAPIPL